MTHEDDAAMSTAGAGMRHVPVLLAEVLEALDPQPGQTIIDGTFGAGGYSAAIMERGAGVIGFDRDPDAIAAARATEAASQGRLRLVQAPFSTLDQHGGPVDGVVLDIGISSMQIDEAERGFSFRFDGPLDMRMAQAGISAADVVNGFKAGDLARIFNFLGEEKQAGRVARMIEKRRASKPFTGTRDLAQAVGDLLGFNPRTKIHPATKVFQALRIFVNDELGELARALVAAERILKPGGKLAVVTFHSLEDRIVKRFIADRSGNVAGSRHLPERSVSIATFDRQGGAVSPSEAEVEANPRSRSARLRAAVRTEAPARDADMAQFDLPKLPEARLAAER
jgi:16S rRNA (cytosine1402-N4)-methyltransferase